ncbi:GNAT family N-acetyltransferase [Salisediminibacterium beveridgei]|uniref:N-acetyltransferase domain-containing protein n=1 Tax=Salisediminibacterium beveridgei TaxID=632773 RepID=A0A1D7QSB4_9BACI|nr:GNAT family N-acetyltransferase [Salisediminibacterium beveridgei]AOM81873.1 hypothetical protein BBEV_0480 [Salisediminibacterium beveridgei]
MFEHTDYFTMERLSEQHLDAIEELQEVVRASLENPDLLVPLSRVELKNIVTEDTGMTVGVFNVRDELVGILGALYPGSSKENLGYALAMDEEKAAQVFHLEITFIDPDYRRMGFMVTMCRWLVQLMKIEGRYRYLCATVSPYNIGSLKNMMLSGNAVVDFQLKYGGLERYIVFQDVTVPFDLHGQDIQYIPIQENPLAPVEYLEKGFLGTSLERIGQEIVMVMKYREKP